MKLLGRKKGKKEKKEEKPEGKPQKIEETEKTAERKGKPKAKLAKKKTRTVLIFVVVALIIASIAIGAFFVVDFLSRAGLIDIGIGGEGPSGVGDKPMTGAMQQVLGEARNQDINGVEVIEGADYVPEGLINPMEGAGTEKFEDLNNLLKVTFELTDKGEATIEEVSTLAEGRISVVPAGDYSVQLLDSKGGILYELPFNAVFFIMSNPPTKVDSLKFVFVLPRKEGAEKIAITKERRTLAEKEI